MLASAYRFHGHNSLTFVYKRGRVVRGGLLVLKYIRNDRRTQFRTAVVVGKKVAKSAVVRNRIRRRVYEIVRLQASQIDGSYDLVFTVFNAQVATMPTDQLQRLVSGQLRQAGVITKSSNK